MFREMTGDVGYSCAADSAPIQLVHTRLEGHGGRRHWGKVIEEIGAVHHATHKTQRAKRRQGDVDGLSWLESAGVIAYRLLERWSLDGDMGTDSAN